MIIKMDRIRVDQDQIDFSMGNTKGFDDVFYCPFSGQNKVECLLPFGIMNKIIQFLIKPYGYPIRHGDGRSGCLHIHKSGLASYRL